MVDIVKRMIIFAAMNYKLSQQLIKRPKAIGMIFFILIAFAFSFHHPSNPGIVQKSDEGSHVASSENPFEKISLSNSPVTAPVPAITKLRTGNLTGGENAKLLLQSLQNRTDADVFYFNYHLKEKSLSFLHDTSLHIAFCVFRI